MKKLIALLFAVALSGCATTSLTSVQSAVGVKPVGIAYWLPTARVTAQLIYQPQRGFALRVALPPLIADQAAGPYYVAYRGSPTENDKVQIEVDEGLLKTVNIASESKLLDTVQGAGESIGAIAAVIEASVSSDQADSLITVRFDPANRTSVATASQTLTDALHAYAKRQIALDGMRDKPKTTDNAAVAEQKIRASLLDAARLARISLTSAFPTIAGDQGDCGIGICYRPLRPGQLDIAVDEIPFTQLGMSIPNGAPAVAFPLARSGASNSGQVLALDHGVLTSATITKDAEAPNIVRIPGTLIGGIIKGLTDTLTARKGQLGAKADVLNAQASIDDARAKLIDSQTALATKRKGSASIEASIDDGGAGDLWLPGLSYLRPVSSSAQPPVVGQNTLQPGQQGGAQTGGAGQPPAQQPAGKPDQPAAGNAQPAPGPGHPTGTTPGANGSPKH